MSQFISINLFNKMSFFIEPNIYSHNLTVNFLDVDENNELTNKEILRLIQEVAGIHVGLFGYGVNDIPII